MATIKVFSGGAPKEVFLRLSPAFEQQTGHKLDFTFAVMSVLRDRLAAGERTDVLVMPTNILDDYEKSGVARGAHRAVLGLVSVNAVVRTGAPMPDLSSPDSVKQAMLNSRAIAHATPGATPSGRGCARPRPWAGACPAATRRGRLRPARTRARTQPRRAPRARAAWPRGRRGWRRAAAAARRCRPQRPQAPRPARQRARRALADGHPRRAAPDGLPR